MNEPHTNNNTSNNQPAPSSNNTEYLAQLLKDKKQITGFPNIFIHLERLLDNEISRIRAILLSTNVSAKSEPLILPDPVGQKITLSDKIYVPIKEYPEFNFIGRILGPRGMTAKFLEQETGCKIMIRGKGSMRDKKKEEQNKGRPNWEHLDDELHVLITVEDTDERANLRMKKAKEEVQRLLVPAAEGEDELKKMQLMELAILNGTFRDPNLKHQINHAVMNSGGFNPQSLIATHNGGIAILNSNGSPFGCSSSPPLPPGLTHLLIPTGGGSNGYATVIDSSRVSPTGAATGYVIVSPPPGTAGGSPSFYLQRQQFQPGGPQHASHSPVEYLIQQQQQLPPPSHHHHHLSAATAQNNYCYYYEDDNSCSGLPHVTQNSIQRSENMAAVVDPASASSLLNESVSSEISSLDVGSGGVIIPSPSSTSTTLQTLKTNSPSKNNNPPYDRNNNLETTPITNKPRVSLINSSSTPHPHLPHYQITNPPSHRHHIPAATIISPFPSFSPFAAHGAGTGATSPVIENTATFIYYDAATHQHFTTGANHLQHHLLSHHGSVSSAPTGVAPGHLMPVSHAHHQLATLMPASASAYEYPPPLPTYESATLAYGASKRKMLITNRTHPYKS